MPPHKQLSGQVFCPVNFDEYCSTRPSGAKDHTWKRAKGPFEKKPTLLPFWMLIFNCEPIRLMLKYFLSDGLLVEVASEDKQNHSITYRWYAPDFNYKFRSAKEMWATTKLDYGMFLQFCKHRLSDQKQRVKAGWVKLKANSEFANRLTDAMLLELMKAAKKLKKLILEVTTATEKGELMPGPMPKPFGEHVLFTVWLALQADNPNLNRATVVAMELLTAQVNSAPATPSPCVTPPPPPSPEPPPAAAPAAAANQQNQTDAAEDEALLAGSSYAALVAHMKDPDAPWSVFRGVYDDQYYFRGRTLAPGEYERAQVDAGLLEAEPASAPAAEPASAPAADVPPPPPAAVLVAETPDPAEPLPVYRAPGGVDTEPPGAPLPLYRPIDGEPAAPVYRHLHVDPEPAAPIYRHPPADEPPVAQQVSSAQDCVAALHSLLRTNQVALAARAGLAALVASQPQSAPLSMGGFDADPSDDKMTRLTMKRLFSDAFERSDARTKFLKDELGGSVLRWPQPGQTPAQLREAQMDREQVTRLLEVEQTAWMEVREKVDSYTKRLGSLINKTHLNNGAFYAEIVREMP